MSKYKPLSDRLSGHQAPEWRASFAEIEEVLGFPLPKTARSGGSWWGDDKRAWREHGWRADDIDHAGGYVTFKRDGQTTAAVAESIVMPEAVGTESQTRDLDAHGAIAPPMPPGRRSRTGPIVAGVAVAAGVAAFLARRILRRRAA